MVSHLYEKLSAARRASLHRRAADILRTTYQYREEEGAAIITHHLVLGGGDSQHIIHYAELAGDRAYALSAYPEAEKHYRTAVEYLEGIARKPTDPQQQLHIAYLLERLGECTYIQGKTEEARRSYMRVLEIRALPVVSVFFNNPKQEAQIQALLWCEIGWTWYGVGNNIETYRCSEKAEKALQDDTIVSGPVWAKIRFQQGYTRWQEGKYEEGLSKAQEALELLGRTLEKQKINGEEIPHLTKIGRSLIGDPVDLGRTHTLLGTIANVLGQPTVAITHFNKALAIYEQYQRLREIGNVSCNLADFYLRKAEHSLAQSTLRRSLSMAEQIGDIPLISVVGGNLGVLAMRLGELDEAVKWLRQSIELAERINDPVYISIIYSYLSIVLQEQGKFVEARKSVHYALKAVRSMYIAPCIGIALLALGVMYSTQIIVAQTDKERIHLLNHAKKMLQRVLDLEDIEAETKTEGKLLLSYVVFMSGEVESARQQALQTLQEAKQYELTWLVARSQRLLGSIMASSSEHEQSQHYFEQALRTFQKRGMYLEESRTLRDRSDALLQRKDVGTDEHRHALEDLHKAMAMFTERGAELDRQITARIFASHKQNVEGSHSPGKPRA